MPLQLNSDPTVNFHGGNAQSTDAHESVVGAKVLMYKAILEFIQHGAATCDEVEVALDLRHQTASARITELKASGALRPTGERRKTRSGRLAAIYTVGSDGEYVIAA